MAEAFAAVSFEIDFLAAGAFMVEAFAVGAYPGYYGVSIKVSGIGPNRQSELFWSRKTQKPVLNQIWSNRQS